MIRIAEAKKRSPWDGELSPLSVQDLILEAILHGDWVSVHTEPIWGGCLRDVEYARKFLKPGQKLLAKGLHLTDRSVKDAFQAGADHVLVVGRVPEDSRCLVEPFSVDQGAEFLYKYGVKNLVWNRRDLFTGRPKDEGWAEARAALRTWLCCASLGEPFPTNADACLFGVHRILESEKGRKS